ncbi:MAG: HEPN domain-containing protein [Methanoregula sp.]|nr:HEPN domain-containing protein [Methanoregula sp.]
MKGRKRSPDNPDEWLQRAKSSLALSRQKTPDVLYEDLGYQAQQAAEKALKAVLVAGKIPCPYTHDINALLSVLEQNDISCPENSGEQSFSPPMHQIPGTRDLTNP